jgi:nitrate/nitrite transport system substrate-binding protein
VTTDLTIGFARLSDCAPLVVAKERGAFEEAGLNVSLKRFGSWAAMRDALATKAIDAAQMLSPMVLASAAGLTPFAETFTTSLVLNLNGNAITVSKSVYEEIRLRSPDLLNVRPLSAAVLKPLITSRQARGEPPLTFAHVYAHSMHAYALRYWLAAGGVNPETDVRLVVIPPERMVNTLTIGDVDAFCVGEPWNNAAVVSGIGHTLINSVDIWPAAPEKVLAVRSRWADVHEAAHERLIGALLNSAVWLDQGANRVTAAQLVCGRDYVDISLDVLLGSLTGQNRQVAGYLRETCVDFNVFHRYAGTFPWRSHAKWILAQMIRWADAPSSLDVDSITSAAFRPETYRRVADRLGTAHPLIDEKIEGAFSVPWVLENASAPIAFSADRFIDGRVFDPANIAAYLDTFGIPIDAKVVPFAKIG